MATADKARDYTVGSVVRALRLIDIVADGPDAGVTLTELTRSLGTSKSSAYALARTLVDAGYLRDVQPGPRYRLGIALVRLGDRAAASHPVEGIVKPILHEISRRTGMTARAAIEDDGYPMFIARVDAPGAIRFHTPLGVRELPHTSAAGKVILASLPEGEVDRIIGETGLPMRTRRTITTLEGFKRELDVTRKRGYGIDDEEDQDGVFCLSVAILRPDGGVFGALSVTGIKSGASIRRQIELANILRKAAAQVAAQAL